MTLILVRVEAAGDLPSERVILRASSDVDIGRYALFSCSTDDGVPLSGSVLRAFWFEDKKIKSGDFVVVYSKDGTNSEKKGRAGATSYFYYWGSRTPLWTPGTMPVLILCSTWTFGSPIK